MSRDLRNVTLYSLMSESEDIAEQIAHAETPEQEAAVWEAMEAKHSEINAKLDAYYCRKTDWEHACAAIDGQIGAVEAELLRLKNRKMSRQKLIARLKDRVQFLLESTGEQKRETDLATWFLRKKPQRVVIDDPLKIPEQYIRTKTTTEPNKTEIAKALKDGDQVPGCTLSPVEYQIGVR